MIRTTRTTSARRGNSLIDRRPICVAPEWLEHRWCLSVDPIVAPSWTEATPQVGEPLMLIRTFPTDLAGNPITAISVGSLFQLHTEVQDIRIPPSALGGVFAAATVVDVGNPALTETSGPVAFDAFYNLARTSTVAGDQVIASAAASSLTPPGPNSHLFFSVTLTATAAGLQVFLPSFSANPQHEYLIYGLNDPLTINDVAFEGSTLQIGVGPVISISDASTTEGSPSGFGPMFFGVSLSAPSPVQVSVNYTTASGTATAGSDFIPASGTITFPPGVTTQFIAVAISADTAPELNETLFVQLSSPVNAIGTPTAVGTIVNDDGGPIISLTGITTVEGSGGGTTILVFEALLSTPSALPVSVSFATSDGTALAGLDYLAAAGAITFAPNTTSQFILVQAIADSIAEPDETFQLNLFAPVGGTVLDPSALIVLLNDDIPPVLSISSAAAGEGGTAIFTASLSAPSSALVQASFATVPGTATAGTDYVAANGALLFAPGVTTQLITVQLLDDTLDESDETFTVNLSAPLNAVGTPAGGGVILDNDPPPRLSITGVSTNEGSSLGVTPFLFTVSLSAPSGQSVVVNFATSDITALAGIDYVATSGTLLFAPGVTSQVITVPVIADILAENPVETFRLSVTPVAGAIGAANTLGAIVDDDSRPRLSISNTALLEGGPGAITDAAFTVSLSGPSAVPVVVNFSTASGTATAGVDFLAITGVLIFPPGLTTHAITVPVLGDAIPEGLGETFTVTLTSPSGALIDNPNGTGTIIDDDVSAALPSISINDVTVIEGQSAGPLMQFTVALSSGSIQPVSVNFNTNSISANSGVDFVGTFGTLNFPPGVTSQVVTVQVIADTLPEPGGEVFQVILSGPVGATLADAIGVGTIADDDNGLSLSISDASVVEGNAPVGPFMEFTVTLSSPSIDFVTVNVGSFDETAIAGIDFAPVGTMLQFPPGVTSQILLVQMIGDTLNEGAGETFRVVLGAPVGATIADGVGIGTIIDDDAPPTISIADAVAVEDATAGLALPFTVMLSKPSATPVNVSYSTVNGTATAGSDYSPVTGTLTFAPGVTSAIVFVAIVPDLLVEPNETFLVTLSAPVGATLADGTAVGTILNDDVVAADTPDTIPTALALPVAPGVTTQFLERIGNNSFGARDVDFYKFQAVSGSRLTVQTSLPPGGASVDTYLRLFNANGMQLITNNNISTFDPYSRIANFRLPATGTYLLGISSYPNDSYNPRQAGSGFFSLDTGDYLLELTVTPPTALAAIGSALSVPGESNKEPDAAPLAAPLSASATSAALQTSEAQQQTAWAPDRVELDVDSSEDEDLLTLLATGR